MAASADKVDFEATSIKRNDSGFSAGNIDGDEITSAQDKEASTPVPSTMLRQDSQLSSTSTATASTTSSAASLWQKLKRVASSTFEKKLSDKQKGKLPAARSEGMYMLSSP
jgi:hypothetical protein